MTTGAWQRQIGQPHAMTIRLARLAQPRPPQTETLPLILVRPQAPGHITQSDDILAEVKISRRSDHHLECSVEEGPAHIVVLPDIGETREGQPIADCSIPGAAIHGHRYAIHVVCGIDDF